MIRIFTSVLENRQFLRMAFAGRGPGFSYEIDIFHDEDEFLGFDDGARIELCILDLPGYIDLGVVVDCRTGATEVPIIVLSDGDQDALVEYLNHGATTVLQYPLSARLVLAQAKALLSVRTIDRTYHDLHYNHLLDKYYRGETELRLTRTERALLSVFLRRPTANLTRDHLNGTLWPDAEPDKYRLDKAISRLRRAVHVSGSENPIKTIPGTGYRLEYDSKRAA